MKTKTALFLCEIICLSILLQVAIFSNVSAKEEQLPADLISPEVGVICNEHVKICYNTFGVSIGITRELMGEEAAEKLTRELAAVDEKYFDRTNFNPVEGVSCHTLEKACYEGDKISKLLSAALFGRNDGCYDAHALLDVFWVWDGSRYNNDTEVRAADDRQYTLIFQADASLKIMADCNRVFAQYNSGGKSLAITLGPSTRMACAPDSQDQLFLRDLAGVAGWFMRKGDLYLDMEADAGTMRFYKGVMP